MNKVAIITGASRGIGAATAARLATDGFDVCINYKSNRSAADTVVKAVKKAGKNALAVQANISCEADVKRLFEETDARLGSLSVLVNNAGILLEQTRVEDITEERVNTLFKSNVTGFFLCCKYAVKRMSTRYGGSGGSVINVSSAASRLGAAGEYVDYAATKGAIDTLTIGLAKEVAGEGIRVNCVRPGFIYTDMHADGGEPARVDRMKEKLPMKRGGEAREVAAAIAWFASQDSSYTTGSFTEVSGGR